MTGPIARRRAPSPGDTLRVELLAMTPRLPYGSNCAANWGLFHDEFGKERITIYELDDQPDRPFVRPGRPPAVRLRLHRPRALRHPGRDLDARSGERRQPFGRPVEVPVRPHLGVMGVAPGEPGRRSSIPPGVFGGNVDNWRFGPGAIVHYPVFVEGPASSSATRTSPRATARSAAPRSRRRSTCASGCRSPTICRSRHRCCATPTHWYTHGFGDDLDEAMRMAAEQMLRLLVDQGGFSMDEAYSLASVAMDLGVTQVVDGTLGCHAGMSASIIGR